MVDYLVHLSSNNINNLKIIRNFLYLILTRNNKYHYALYLYGTGGSGKSVFESIIQALVGKYVKSMKMEDIKDKHAKIDLIDAAVALFPDIKSYKGDVTDLKNLISGDLMNGRELYKNKVNFKPNCIVVMTSNSLWQPKDSTTGIHRRFIYVSIDKIPKNRNINLLNIDDGKLSGLLVKSLPGLVNWAMDAYKEDLKLFDKSAKEINELTSPDLDKEVNPLLDWIDQNLYYCPGNKVLVGNKKTQENNTLYPNYLKFCYEYGYTPLSIIDFSNSLIQQMNLLWKDYNCDIFKKRTSKGVVINNVELVTELMKKEIELNSKYIENNDYNSNDDKYSINVENTFGDYIY